MWMSFERFDDDDDNDLPKQIKDILLHPDRAVNNFCKKKYCKESVQNFSS